MQEIIENGTYQQVLKDSFGGILYDVANRDKYDDGKDLVLYLWSQLTPAEKESAGGIMRGAINFLEGK